MRAHVVVFGCECIFF